MSSKSTSEFSVRVRFEGIFFSFDWDRFKLGGSDLETEYFSTGR
jgi:hypothetical protein